MLFLLGNSLFVLVWKQSQPLPLFLPVVIYGHESNRNPILRHGIGLYDAIYVAERLQESKEFHIKICFLLISCREKNSQATDESPLSATPL